MAAFSVVAFCCGPVIFFSIARSLDILSRCIHIDIPELYSRFTGRVHLIRPRLLYARTGSDTALHNYQAYLTLFGANERTFTQQLAYRRLRYQMVAFTPAAMPLSHLWSPLIYSSCTSTLSHSAVLPTISALLRVQDVSEAPHFYDSPSSAGSIRIWAGHIKLRRTIDSLPGSWAD